MGDEDFSHAGHAGKGASEMAKCLIAGKTGATSFQDAGLFLVTAEKHNPHPGQPQRKKGEPACFPMTTLEDTESPLGSLGRGGILMMAVEHV